MKKLGFILLALALWAIPAAAETYPNGAPRTTNNDDSCDIATLPAATLLLPYFEVDVDNFTGQTTLFTVTNVTNVDTIGRVTLWTDYGFPVISFNLYLTGYDVQAINLFDVIVRGIIAPDAGTGTAIRARGPNSDVNPALDLSRCDRLPGSLDNVYVERMMDAFTLGTVDPIGSVLPGCDTVGGVHENAIGYATIDVVGNCLFAQPTETDYFANEIRFDNVLTGDYQQLDATNNYAQANPLVHIRAVPEGGTPAQRRNGSAYRTNLARTFYDRYSPANSDDARQPLPSTFAARWVQGSGLGFQTFYKTWREVPTGAGAVCDDYAGNTDLPITEVVVFDENENFVAQNLEEHPVELAATSLTAVSDDMLPQMTNGAVSGWMYLNLDSETGDQEAQQGWVVVSMRSQGRFSVDFDATALGNGCSPERAPSEATTQGAMPIGPAPNTTL
jgi:hypothetical protein